MACCMGLSQTDVKESGFQPVLLVSLKNVVRLLSCQSIESPPAPASIASQTKDKWGMFITLQKECRKPKIAETII